MYRTYRLESSNSPRILAILLRGARLTSAALGASFEVLSETKTEIVIKTDVDVYEMEKLAREARDESFIGEYFFCTLLTEVGEALQ